MRIPVLEGEVPYLDTAQMIEVDRAMIEDYRIELIQMMENAGRCLAIVARERFLDSNPIAKQVIVMAGGGGNGGGALVAARRLHNWGAEVQVVLAQASNQMTAVPRHQLDILDQMRMVVSQPGALLPDDEPQLIIDGLVGYSLKGAPYGMTRDLIGWANAKVAPILALDTPSGIDTTTGTAFDPAIRATATMTLALPKVGLRSAAAADHTGELYLADISVPPSLYSEAGLDLQVGPIFANGDVVRL